MVEERAEGSLAPSAVSSSPLHARRQVRRVSKPSKYETDFTTVDVLSVGSAGVVLRAHHKLLDMDFLIKCVALSRDQAGEDMLVEARALAKASHPNVARFYSCWVERKLPPALAITLNDLARPWSPSSSSLFLETDHPFTTISTGLFQTPSSSTDTLCSLMTESCVVDSPLVTSIFDGKPVLFLQMELYDKTLSDSLPGAGAEGKLVWMAQLAAGVQYIHQLNIAHTELHPTSLYVAQENLFLSDLGNLSNVHEGRRLYQAPEEAKTMASDVFSMGLIFLEAFGNWSDAPQCVSAMQEAREGSLPGTAHPAHTTLLKLFDSLIRFMLSDDPAKRPTIADVVLAVNTVVPFFAPSAGTRTEHMPVVVPQSVLSSAPHGGVPLRMCTGESSYFSENASFRFARSHARTMSMSMGEPSANNNSVSDLSGHQMNYNPMGMSSNSGIPPSASDLSGTCVSGLSLGAVAQQATQQARIAELRAKVERLKRDNEALQRHVGCPSHPTPTSQ